MNPIAECKYLTMVMITSRGAARIAATTMFALTMVITVSAQNDPRTAMLQRDGWNALERNQPHEAAAIFREALAREPGNADLHLGAGVAAYRERRDLDAQAALTRALELNPASTRAREFLGLVLYRTGNVLEAIRVYERIPNTPEHEQERFTLDRWRRELDLHSRMINVSSAWFTVSFDGAADADLASRALDSLERAAQRIGDVLSTYPVKPISVVLYAAEQFRDITRAPLWAGGAYDGTIRVPMRGALDKQEELDRVLAHEFTHALVHTLAPRNVPAWLNEGLAAALEGNDHAAENRSIGGPLPPDILSALQTSFGRFNGEQARLAYAISARAARDLLDDAGGFAVANLLRDLGSGVAFESAFEHRIQRSFSSFESDLATAR